MNQFEPENILKLEEVIDAQYRNLTGIMVQQNGANVYEKYFHGFTSEDAIHVYSVTKSIFSALIGIAIEKGLISSVNQKVFDFFPEYPLETVERSARNITIRHLLTMTAPYKYKPEPYEAFFSSDNWVNAALDTLGGEDPVGEFQYSPIIGAHILSGVLSRATGETILDFATEHIFSPLGIPTIHSIVLHSQEEQLAFYEKSKHKRGWVVDPQGIHTASWGLTLTTEDMTKIGQLYLNGGAWDGRQLIPENWVEVSTKEFVTWNALSYGYLWWVIDNKEHIYAAMGDGGNVIYVNAKKKLVISIASFFIPNAKDRISFIMEYIEPLF